MKTQMTKIGGCLLLAATLFLATDGPAFAATVTVQNGNDSGAGSLRDAITNANSGDTIKFDPALNGQTIQLSSGQIVILKSITLQGPGANVLTVKNIAGAGQFNAIFRVASGVTAASISGLTITGGSAEFGGGIFNDGALALANCTISANSSVWGGGIWNSNGATVRLTGCTVSANTTSPSGGTDSFGGGIWNDKGGAATLTNCTISGNSATTAGGAIGTNGTVTLTNCTISANSASAGGGIATNGTVTIGNTIVAGNAANSGPDVLVGDGSVSSQGSNLIGKTDGSTGWVGGDITGTIAAPRDPKLASLADNGGPTQTMALLPGSPAIDKGDDSVLATVTTDQRGTGFPRKSGFRVDIGAYEVQSIRWAKLALVTSMTNYAPSLKTPSDAGKFAAAIQEVKDSVDASLWLLDGNHVVVKTGKKVFHEEKEAVSLLQSLLRKTTDSATIAKLKGFIDTMEDADRQLATIAIADGSVVPHDQTKIDAAIREFKEGDADRAAGKFAEAIEDYSDAWKKAQQATGGRDADDDDDRERGR